MATTCIKYEYNSISFRERKIEIDIGKYTGSYLWSNPVEIFSDPDSFTNFYRQARYKHLMTLQDMFTKPIAFQKD